MKLLNINVSIKINNTEAIAEFVKEINPDILALQEVGRHLEDTVFPEYRTKFDIEKALDNNLPYRFFGPMWISEAMRVNGKIHRDFGGLIEQGNEILSKYRIIEATNEHFYKFYSYAIDWTNWEKEDHGRSLQVVTLSANEKPIQILNIHGIWTKDKMGDQRTIDECEYVVRAAKRKNIPTIIAGDFNLLPKTDSIQIINKSSKNLIEEYNIKTTRPDFKDNVDIGNHVVDYIFINKDIKVKEFKVIDTNISDHLPLLLEFEI